MRRTFLTNLAFLVFLNLLIKPFWIFGIDRTVQNVVGTQEYGLYFALFNFSLIWNMLLDMGITNYNNRNIARHTFLLNKYFSNLISLRLLLALVYFGFGLSMAFVWGYQSQEIKFLLILLFNQFLLSFIAYLRSNIAGLHLFKTDSLLSVLDRFLMILICGVLLWGGVTQEPFNVTWFAWSQTAAYSITALLAFALVLYRSGSIKLRLNKAFSLTVLKKSFPYALLALLMAFYTRFDAVLIERLLPDGKHQAGVYAQAFRILDAAGMLALLFASLLLPIFSRMIKKRESVSSLLKLASLLILIPGIILVTATYFHSNSIMELLYYENTDESAKVLSILMFSFVGIALTYIFGTLLTANGSLSKLNKMALIGVLVNLGLNIWLIPKFNALGAAGSALITQTLTAGIQVFVALRVFKIKVNYNLLILILIFALGVGIAGYLSKALPLYWMWQLLLMLIFSFILAWSIGLIKLKPILYILQKQNER